MLRVADKAYRTDTGRQRRANEDAYYVRAPVFVVADGMGGAQAGEVASRIAAEAFDGELPPGPENALRSAFESANREIHEHAARDEARAGMGTTLTAAIVDAEHETVSIGHVGDSRAYRLRDSELERLTQDHSLVEELRRKGQLTDAQAEEHPQRSIITRALGPEAEVEPDVGTFQARAGDLYLICSDGLTTMIGEQRITEVLGHAEDLDAAVRTLVEEANRAGGRDNITAVVFRLEEVGAPAPEAEHPTLVGPSAEAEGLHAEEMRAAAPRQREPRPRGRVLKGAAKVLAVLLVLGALGFGAWYGNRQIWFLGTDDAGRVGLYRGLPYELPFGIDLYQQRYASPIQTSSVPGDRRDSVTGHELRSRGDAVSLIEDLERAQGALPPSAETAP
ncbi:MAG: Stp1/IreP family PP2C-type Ser/Thr phosphatase [Solirubrobacterales bacterium]